MNIQLILKKSKLSFLLFLGTLFSSSIYAQNCAGNLGEVTLQNIVVTSNTLEYDIYVKNIGTTTIRVGGFNGNTVYTAGLLGAGTGTFTVIQQPSTCDFPTLANIVLTHTAASQQLRYTQTIQSFATGNQVNMPIGMSMKFARVRFTNSIPFALSSFTLSLPIGADPVSITRNNLTVTCEANTNATNLVGNSTPVTLNAGGPYNLTTDPCPASTTWNGTAWSNNAPDSQTKATFTGNFTAAANLIACSVSVSGTAVVSIPSNFNMTVTNEVTVASTASLVFENNSNLIQINTATNTGEITYKRNAAMRRLDFTYWSSPVANQNLLAFSPNTLQNRFNIYDEPSKSFVSVSPTTANFVTPRGYSLRAPNNFLNAPAGLQTFNGVFKGVPNNGNYSIPVTFTAAPTGGNGYNLIGNPYPSTVSAIAFLTANTGSLYFWTHQLLNAGQTNYASYNLSGGTAATAGGPGVMPNGFIQTGQGFMFLTTTSKNVNFTNAMRQANNANQFFRTLNNQTENNKIWLNLTNNDGLFSQTLVGYLPNTTTAFDDGYDAPQLNTNGLSSMISNNKYAIQARGNFDNTDVVKLNLNLDTAGSYTISKDNTEGIFSNAQVFFLKDNLIGIIHNIKQTPYNFVANAGAISNRFEIVYQSVLSNNSNLFTAESVIVFENNKFLNITSTQDLKAVKVFDVQGRTIFETNAVNAKSTVLTNFRPQQQVLLVQITSLDNQVVTKKVVF
jgi:hypothetical protein